MAALTRLAKKLLQANAARERSPGGQAQRQLASTNSPWFRRLALVAGTEQECLFWIYHKGGRVRTSQDFHSINALVELGLLAIDDRSRPRHDRFFHIPPQVREAMAQGLGAPETMRATGLPPWIF